MLQREDQQRHEKQCRDQLNDTPGEKIQHGAAYVPGMIVFTSASAR
jgi:hypothetical protein